MLLWEKPLNVFTRSVFQRFGEKEESEGAVWQLGHSGGRVEGPEEEEEEVKYTNSIFNASLKSSVPSRCGEQRRQG